MGLISKMRKQNAIYWPPATVDAFGRPTYGALVELILIPGGVNYRVRWEDRIEDFMDAQGTSVKAQAVVYVPVLPGGGEMAYRGFLWLGGRAGLTNEVNPTLNPGAYEVKRFDKLPNLKATEYLRTVYL